MSLKQLGQRIITTSKKPHVAAVAAPPLVAPAAKVVPAAVAAPAVKVQTSPVTVAAQVAVQTRTAAAVAESTVSMPTFTEIGTTRQLTPAVPQVIIDSANLVLVAPNVYAEPNAAAGQAAFDACIAGPPGGPTGSPMVCEIQRSSAVATDAQARLAAALDDVYDGKATLEAAFTAGKLWLVRS